MPARVKGALAALFAGALAKQTMREFDEACLTPVRPMKPTDIRAIRENPEAFDRDLERRGDAAEASRARVCVLL